MDDSSIFKTIAHHWPLVLATWLASNAISALPTPNGSGFTGSKFYKWAFGFLHGSVGNLPRVVATLFPQIVAKAVQMFFGVKLPEEEKPTNVPDGK